MSPTKVRDREVMITPSASIPTNSKPIAVSLDSRDLRVINEMPVIITAALTAAPKIPDTPMSRAAAMPGTTPWARASPTNDRPRSTT